MSIATSLGADRYQASESDLLLRPRLTRPARGAVFCHGAGQDALVGVTPTFTGQYPLVRAIAARLPMVAADLGGDTWGNATAQARTETARTYLGSALGATVDKVHLLGISMGALTALQYAKANPTKVQSISLIIPAVDLDHVYQNDVLGQRASIGTAWGVTYPTALPAEAKPLDDASSWDAFPMKAWYATDDPVTPTASVETFLANAGATGVSLGAEGHDEQAVSLVDPDDVVAFMEAA